MKTPSESRSKSPVGRLPGGAGSTEPDRKLLFISAQQCHVRCRGKGPGLTGQAPPGAVEPELGISLRVPRLTSEIAAPHGQARSRSLVRQTNRIKRLSVPTASTNE